MLDLCETSRLVPFAPRIGQIQIVRRFLLTCLRYLVLTVTNMTTDNAPPRRRVCIC